MVQAAPPGPVRTGVARRPHPVTPDTPAAVRYPRGPMSPLFADDNSSYRRAMRKQEAEAKRREERREQILETLRRLREKAADPAELAAEERARRHKEMLERYPPLF